MATLSLAHATRIRVVPKLGRSVASTSTALPSARYLQLRGTRDEPDAATQETPKTLTQAQKEMLHAALRIDQAGEVAANWIYKGQLAVLGRDPKSGPVIEVCIPFTRVVMFLLMGLL
jgi:3-demethoxyubiquinol 3-hydroxylase